MPAKSTKPKKGCTYGNRNANGKCPPAPKPPCKSGEARVNGHCPKKPSTRKRKVLRDTIQGVTKPALTRIAHVAGIKSVSGLMFEELRGVMRVYLEDLMRSTVTFTEYAKRKTVSGEDVLEGLKVIGDKMYALSTNKKSDIKVPTCKISSAKKVETRMAHYQRNSGGCVTIPQAAFARLMREIAADYFHDLKFSKAAFVYAQLATEKHIIKLLAEAQRAAIHAHRVRVKPSNLKLVRNTVKFTSTSGL